MSPLVSFWLELPGTVTIGSCPQVPLDHPNNVGFGNCRHYVSPGGAVPQLALPSVSVPYLVLVLPLDRNIAGSKNFEMDGLPLPLTRDHV